MMRDLPKWMASPFVVLPFFACCIAVPLLIGISDRAAQFAGGLTAALAAVIAVILGGMTQRANDRARERRAYAVSMQKLVRELIMTFEMFEIMLSTTTSSLNKELKDPHSHARLSVSRSEIVENIRRDQSVPERLVSEAYGMNDAVTLAILGYAARRELLRRSVERLPLETINRVEASQILEGCNLCQEGIKTALNVLKAYQSELHTLSQM